LNALALVGVNAVVINTGWLGDQIEPALGMRFTPNLEPGHVQPPMAANKLQLRYSHEGRGAGEALETAGGIVRALPMLADVFWVAAGDIYAPEFGFSPEAYERFKASTCLAHIWLVPNPAHNPGGDFGLSAAGLALNVPKTAVMPGPAVQDLDCHPAPHAAHPPRYTFSTIALYKRAFFEAAWCPIAAGNPEGKKATLAPMLRAAMDQGLVSASLYEGLWVDVGTPERLAQLNKTPSD
jgi:MurNAc alpha-1-phosphate uridylyltransferase